jgi:hypothetical protein
MKASKVVALASREANLKRRVRAHLKGLGFRKAKDGSLVPPALDKVGYRAIHAHQRAEKLRQNREWLSGKVESLGHYFASGGDIDVIGMRPRLELVAKETWQSDLFRLAGLYWQIPISEGYGRRLRFLIWDDSNKKLIGLLALGDAVFNLRARDEFVGWDHKRRGKALVHLMDAYVLGALPPYNALLGGKLVASLIRTREIVDVFAKRYRDARGVISGVKKNARLAAVTTTSALGRSSIYNRVKLNGYLLLQPIGFTSGWGHFHISDALFEDLRGFLKFKGDRYASAFKYGNGPNWRIRVIRRALTLLDMDPDLIRHGFTREVFVCPIAKNAVQFLRGDHTRIRYGELPSVEATAKMAIERWCIPRSTRRPEYLEWKVSDTLNLLRGGEPKDHGAEQEGKRSGLGT